MADFFSMGGNVRSTVKINRFAQGVYDYTQQSLQEAERAGRQVLEANMPKIVTGRLDSSVESGENQHSVWFRVAGTIDGKPYGFAQEFGWHDTSPAHNFHEGHHMVEKAGEAAAATFTEFMGGLAGGVSGGAQRYEGAGLGEVGGYQPRGFSGDYEE